MIYGAEIFKYKTLGEMVDAAKIAPKDYNWLISGHDIIPRHGGELFGGEYVWFSGEEFADVIKSDDYYMVWCVASAFPRSVTLDEVLKYELPYADGNGGFWVDDVKLQTPLSKMELVIFDGWFGFLLSDDVRHRDNFLAAFPEAFDLVEDNRINNARIETIGDVLGKTAIEASADKPDRKKPEWEVYHQIFGRNKVPENMKAVYEQCRAALEEKGLLAKKNGDRY